MAFPAYLSKTETGVTASSNAVSVAAPAGVASGNYQLLVLSISSGSVTLGTTPSGWTLLADDQVDSSTSPDRGGSQRVALFESTTATGAFTMTLSGTARIWAAVRLAWTLPAGGGRTVALAKTIEATGTSTTSKALPAITAGAVDSLAIGIGAADLTNASAWTGTGTYTQRSLYATGSASEWEYFAVGDLQVAASTAGVTGTFTMSPGDEAALYQVILNGTASATTANKNATDNAAGSDSAGLSQQYSAADSATGTDTGSYAIPVGSSEPGTGSDSASGLTAAVAGSDARTGLDSLSINAAVSAAVNTGAGVESALIGVSAADPGAGADTLSSLVGRPAATNPGTGSDGATIETLYGDLVISLYAIHPTTGALVPLPDFTKLTLSPQRNSAGSISLEYPTTGLNFDLLRSTITSDRDLEVEIWNLGSPTGALRGYLQEAAGDDVSEDGLWQFAGGFLELRMSEAVLFPQPVVGVPSLGEEVTVVHGSISQAKWDQLLALGYTGRAGDSQEALYVPVLVLDAVNFGTPVPVLADPKRELKVSAVTPGGLVGLIMTQARARGTLTDIEWDFTGSTDSGGTPWPNVLSTKFSPGATYDQILDKLVDLGLAEWSVEWSGTKRVLRLWVPEGRGLDRTLGNRPVVLRKGRNLLEAPRKWSVRESGTAILAAGSEGIYETAADATALARRGRRIEVSASANNVADSGAVQAYAQAQLAVATPGLLEVTHGIGFLPGEPRPIVAFDVGDWVYSQTSTSMDRLRVVQWTLTVDAKQNQSGTVTLNDTVQDALVRLQRRINALTSGETVVGTSTANPADDTMPPAAPTGLVVGSNIAYQVPEHTQTLAELIIGWGEVTTNADGTPAVDVDSYRVQYTYLGAAQVGTILDPGPGYDPGPLHWIEPSGSPVRGLALRFGEVEAGVAVAVRVAAIDRSGNQSAWSSSLEITTASDDTPAPVPAAPTLSVWFRTIDITSNGLGSAGEAMPSDWDHNEVWLSQAASPTLPAPASEPVAFNPAETGAQHVANLYGAGTWNQPDIPIGIGWYAVLRSVDRTGNVSAPSAVAGPVTAEKLVQIDIGPGAIGRQQVIDGEIVRAKIGDAAINSAKVEELQAGLITTGTMTATVTNSGIIQTASTGSRLRFDSSGLQLYNAANTLVGRWNTADASMLMTGTFRTALSGERLELLPDGTLRLYPAAGTNYNAIYNEGGGGLIFRSGFDGSNRAGFLYLRSNSAQISYGTPGTLIASSRLQCSVDASELWGGQIVYRADRNFGTTHRHTFTQFSGNADIFNTVLYLQDTGGTGQFPWFHSIGGNSGMIFGPNYMATANNAANLIELRASNVASPSSRRLKQREKVIGWTRPGRVEPVTALDVIRGAKAKEWEYIHEAKGTRPPRPGKNQQRILDEQGRPRRDADGREMFEEVDVEWSWEEQPAPKHYGPMAEDLEALAPDLVRRDPEDPGMIYTDVRDLLGVLWKAVDELADQLDTRTDPRTIRP